MLDFGFYNMDCMQGMKEFPDKFFDLAIVDPYALGTFANRVSDILDNIGKESEVKPNESI